MSWEQTIKKGDIVRDLETGQYEVISVIQWEHNRYQFKWRSNWRYGTDRIEKVEPFDFIEFANGLKRIVEQQQQEIERLKEAEFKACSKHHEFIEEIETLEKDINMIKDLAVACDADERAIQPYEILGLLNTR